jgi:hypothetical protein
LSSSIWNPPIAVALTKFALAFAMAADRFPPMGFAAVIVAALAVQTHLSALLVALPLIVFVVWRFARQQRLGAAAAVLLCGLIVAAPVIISAGEAVHSASGGVGSSLRSALANPAEHLRIAESTRALGAAVETILLHPFSGAWIQWWLVLGAALMCVGRGHVSLRVLAVGSLVAAVAVFALWQGTFSERYNYLVVTLPAVLCLLAPLQLLGQNGRTMAAAVLAVVVASLQPPRARETWNGSSRLPEYGPLAAGVTRISSQRVPVCAVYPDFAVARGMDPMFLLRMAGGTITADADLTATIHRDGTVNFRRGC